MAVGDTRDQARLSAQLDSALDLADRNMRAKCAEIAASLPFKSTDMASIIRDAQKLFDWITTGKLRGPRTLNDGDTIDPHFGELADIGTCKGDSSEGKLPPMPAATAFHNVVEQIVREARGDDGGT